MELLLHSQPMVLCLSDLELSELTPMDSPFISLEAQANRREITVRPRALLRLASLHPIYVLVRT